MAGILRPGKLPQKMLTRLLADCAAPGSEVVVGPGVGLDAAVLDIGCGEEYLIVKTDPITFVAEDIGSYAIAINANDVACMGGTPRWFTMAVILPEGFATEEMAESVFRSASKACKELGVSLVGGHTEITHGVDRPIVVGHMLGTVPKGRLITSAGAVPGDAIILTKGIAIEAVSVIARVKSKELSESYHEEFINTCKDFFRTPGVSVVKDARVALGAGDVHSMHDPTEGGLATGLYEIAEAANVGIEVRAADIRVLPEAFELLGRLGLDPLGSIASGALLITAPPGDADKIIAALQSDGIDAYDIGRVTEKSQGVKLIRQSGTDDLPMFERDEITKIF